MTILVVILIIVVLGVGGYLFLSKNPDLLGNNDEKTMVQNSASDDSQDTETNDNNTKQDEAVNDTGEEQSKTSEEDANSSDAEVTNSDESLYNWLSTQRVTGDDIAGLPKGELRIMRNWIYARHGYIFKSADLRAYFSNFSWYVPRYSDVNSQLNSIEKYNITFIKNRE